MSRQEAFDEGRNLIDMRGRKRDAVVFDMDGTLADVSSIRHHVRPDPTGKRKYKDFDAFHRESVNVPPNHDVVAMAQQHAAEGKDIIIVTARRAKYRNETAMWLAQNGVPSHAMFMRADDDGRPDYEVKKDILSRMSQSFNVVHAVDDNPNVLKLWHENGIPTTRVPGWEDEDDKKP